MERESPISARLHPRAQAHECSIGNHAWEYDWRLGYAGYEEGTATCSGCGRVEKAHGGKTYEPPYWAVHHSTVLREGRATG